MSKGEKRDIGFIEDEAEPFQGLCVLSVGVNRYPYVKSKKNFPDLMGAAPDARRFFDYMCKTFDVDEAESELLIDGSATLSEILERIERIKGYGSSAQVVIYLAGHGGQMNNAGKTSVFFPFDYDNKNTSAINSSSFKDALGELHMVKDVLVVFDICFPRTFHSDGKVSICAEGIDGGTFVDSGKTRQILSSEYSNKVNDIDGIGSHSKFSDEIKENFSHIDPSTDLDNYRVDLYDLLRSGSDDQNFYSSVFDGHDEQASFELPISSDICEMLQISRRKNELYKRYADVAELMSPDSALRILSVLADKDVGDVELQLNKIDKLIAEREELRQSCKLREAFLTQYEQPLKVWYESDKRDYSQPLPSEIVHHMNALDFRAISHPVQKGFRLHVGYEPVPFVLFSRFRESRYYREGAEINMRDRTTRTIWLDSPYEVREWLAHASDSVPMGQKNSVVEYRLIEIMAFCNWVNIVTGNEAIPYRWERSISSGFVGYRLTSRRELVSCLSGKETKLSTPEHLNHAFCTDHATDSESSPDLASNSKVKKNEHFFVKNLFNPRPSAGGLTTLNKPVRGAVGFFLVRVDYDE